MADENSEENFNSENEESAEDNTFWSKGKNAINSGKNKLLDITDNVHRSIEDDSNESFYASFAYVPLVGPIIGWFFKKRQKLTQEHSINASYLQITFIIIWLTIWLLENLPIISQVVKAVRFSPNITDAAMYVNVVLLIVLSVYGAYQASQKKVWFTPYLFNFLNRWLKLKRTASNNSLSD